MTSSWSKSCRRDSIGSDKIRVYTLTPWLFPEGRGSPAGSARFARWAGIGALMTLGETGERQPGRTARGWRGWRWSRPAFSAGGRGRPYPPAAGQGSPRRRPASAGSSFPRLLPHLLISFLTQRQKRLKFEWLFLSGSVHRETEVVRWGKNLLFFFFTPTPKGHENLLEMLRAGFEIFRAAGADNANVFKA